MAGNRRTVNIKELHNVVSGFALTQILKLHPRDNSNTLNHSKLAQSLYTYPEAMAGNRRTVNIKELHNVVSGFAFIHGITATH